MSILLALAAAVSFGTSDFLALFLTKRIGTYRTLLYTQLPGLLGLSAYCVVSGVSFSASWQTWAWTLALVVINLLSALAFYRSLQVGVASITSPIVASYAAVAVLLSVLTGEVLSLSRGLGMSAALMGVAMTALPPSTTPERQQEKKQNTWQTGVGLALIAALGYGIAFWILGARVTPQLGPIAPIWLIRVFTPCILIACAGLFRQSVRIPRGTVWWLIGAVSLFDTMGYVGTSSALATATHIAIIGVLVSLYSAVTILLAWICLRERLQWSQWLGVGIIFVGIVLVNV
ncbi:MAG TPA: DMT family transporter [Ktedonobacterales bacterium]